MSSRLVTSSRLVMSRHSRPARPAGIAMLAGLAGIVAAAAPASARSVVEMPATAVVSGRLEVTSPRMILAQAAAAPTAPAAPAKPLVVPTTPVTPAAPSTGAPATTAPVAPAQAAPSPAVTTTDESQAIPEVHYGEEGLPEPVKALRRRILAAAKTGDINQLKPIFQSAGQQIELSGGDTDDPVATLKLLSGDGAGREILAIMEDVFDAGWVHVDAGTPQETYLWPYFARYPLSKLTPPQLVELFRVITAGDFQDMQDKGVYSFYRAGIAPDGTWQFFEDGD